MAHTSPYSVCPYYLNACGLIYKGVPTLKFLPYNLASWNGMAKPKSANLGIEWSINILAGLMSLCIKPFLFISTNADITHYKILIDSYSSNLPFFLI